RSPDAAAQIAEENAQIPLEARLRTSLRILVEREEELYRQHFDGRAMSRRALTRLLWRVTILRDAMKSGGVEEYRTASLKALEFRRSFRIKLALQRHLGIARPLARDIADRFEAQVTARIVIRELQAFTADQLRRLFG